MVHAIPKRKETDLFEGRIWIDNQDFAIVKITGRLAKDPSFWVKRVDFVREYQKINGFWLLSSEEAISAVRIFGRETLTVDYRNYVVNGSATLQSVSNNAARGEDEFADKLTCAMRDRLAAHKEKTAAKRGVA